MSTTFICQHCKSGYRKNPRIKQGQRYCGSRACQQARKNKWERDRLRTDFSYRTRRQSSKSRCYKARPGDAYQRAYRSTHPDYVISNRINQCTRKVKRYESEETFQIVKTDTLTSESLVRSGFYALFPCKDASGEKIVKTDGLIVQLSGIQHNAAFLFNKSP